jgi:DnaJ-class molecular chaperone
MKKGEGMTCPYCDGEGFVTLEAGFYRDICRYCNGRGEVDPEWECEEDFGE